MIAIALLPAPAIAGYLPAITQTAMQTAMQREIENQNTRRAVARMTRQRAKAKKHKPVKTTFTAPVWRPIPGAVMVRGWGVGMIVGEVAYSGGVMSKIQSAVGNMVCYRKAGEYAEVMI